MLHKLSDFENSPCNYIGVPVIALEPISLLMLWYCSIQHQTYPPTSDLLLHVRLAGWCICLNCSQRCYRIRSSLDGVIIKNNLFELPVQFCPCTCCERYNLYQKFADMRVLPPLNSRLKFKAPFARLLP